MLIWSPAFNKQGIIPRRYTCEGKDVNPPLTIDEVPEGTVTLALIVTDIDSKAGTWTHWMIWNIGPDVRHIRENEVPWSAEEGINDFGNPGWGGPCPEKGTHRYVFKLYALDASLNIEPEETTVDDLMAAMEGQVIAETETIGSYRKSVAPKKIA
jgi:Raf kinase inhibitor-like YbhB/YbcL family protein